MHKTNECSRKQCLKTTSSIGENSSSASKNIYDLPEELLTIILSFLSIKELCSIIALVCKQWNSLASDLLLHKHLFISNVYLDCENDTIRSSTKALPSIYKTNYLNGITLTDCSGITLIFKRVSPKYEHLKYLKFVSCFMKEKYIYFLIDTFPNIQRLELFDSLPMYKHVDGHSNRAAFGTTLRTLSITSPDYIDSKWLRILAIICPSVVEFCFQGNAVEDDLVYFLEIKKDILEKLVIKEMKFTNKTLQVLSKCTKLKSLGLGTRWEINKTFPRYISHLKDLTRVSFYYLNIFATEPLAVFFTLKEGKSLECIDLDCRYKTNDTMLVGIADHKNTLRHLRLKTPIPCTDAGINRLLKECTSLQTLSLVKYYGLSEAIVKTILTCLPNLRVLFLYDCERECDRVIKTRIEKSNKRIQVLTDRGSFVSI